MKVLVVVRRSPIHRYLVSVRDTALIEELKALISLGKYSKAVVTVLSRGFFEREVRERELAHLSADLILTEQSARWDLVK